MVKFLKIWFFEVLVQSRKLSWEVKLLKFFAIINGNKKRIQMIKMTKLLIAKIKKK